MNNFWKSFLCVLACVFLFTASFLTGYFYRDTVIYNEQQSLSAVSPLDSTSGANSLSLDSVGSIYLGNMMTMLNGFTSAGSSDSWLPWSSFTNATAVPGSAYTAYNWSFYLDYQPSNYEPNVTTISLYCGAYYNTGENLLGVSSANNDMIIYNNMSTYRTFTLSVGNDGSPPLGGYSLHYADYPFRSNNAPEMRTRIGICYKFGTVNNSIVAPSLNFVKRSIGNYTSINNPFNSLGSSNNLYNAMSSGRYNWISWTDSTGFSISVAIPVYYTATNTPENRPMWYYTDSVLYYYDGSVSDPSDNYYQQGYDTGYQAGVLDGESLGYDSGYSEGYLTGEFIGYNNGINATNQYTFSNLLIAVVETPVHVFTSLLDFNIMGYNLLSLVVGLLSLGIIVLVIKLCLGGK